MKVEELKSVPVDNSIRVRFIPVENTGNNDKMPKYRASLSLVGGFSGLCLEAPIFQDAKSGAYSVSMPGGRFSAVKAEPKTIEVNGTEHVLAESSEAGTVKVKNWDAAIKTAFLLYLNTKNPVQTVTL